jgi:hypothetical protein
LETMVKTAPSSTARAVAAAVLLLGCQADPPCGLRTCDIREADCQKTAAIAAACLLGQPAIEVPVELVTRQQLVNDAVTETNQSDLGRETIRLQALSLLDLADPDVTPVQASTALTARTGAYYSGRDKKITIVVEGNGARPLDGPYDVGMLVHESAHAIQDSLGHLSFPRADGDATSDRRMARGVMVEGEASLAGTLTTLGLYGYDVGDVPWEITFARLGDLAGQGASGSQIPADIAYSYFAYPFGLAVAYRAWASGGTAALTQLWAQPPLSSRQALLPPTVEPLPDQRPIEPLGDDAVPMLPAASAYFSGDRVGAFVFELFIRRAERRAGVSPSRARAFAGQVAGDFLSIFTAADGPSIYWRLRFPSVPSANLALAYVDQIGAHRWSVVQRDRDLIIVGTPPNGLMPPPTTTWTSPPPPAPPAPGGAAPSVDLTHGCWRPGPLTLGAP